MYLGSAIKTCVGTGVAYLILKGEGGEVEVLGDNNSRINENT